MISRELLGLILFVVVLVPMYTYMLTKRGYIKIPLDSAADTMMEGVESSRHRNSQPAGGAVVSPPQQEEEEDREGGLQWEHLGKGKEEKAAAASAEFEF
jgi:hypothetical protein